MWDIESQRKGGTALQAARRNPAGIPFGVSLGIQPKHELLIAKIEQELEAGSQRIKLKIKPGNDVKTVTAVCRTFPVKLMVDANSTYGLQDVGLLREFDSCDLLMIEQPLAWDELYEHAKLRAQLRTAICLDECVHNARHAIAAIELGACRVINLKLGRVGGHTDAMHVLCRSRLAPLCGGLT